MWLIFYFSNIDFNFFKVVGPFICIVDPKHLKFRIQSCLVFWCCPNWRTAIIIAHNFESLVSVYVTFMERIWTPKKPFCMWNKINWDVIRRDDKMSSIYVFFFLIQVWFTQLLINVTWFSSNCSQDIQCFSNAFT